MWGAGAGAGADWLFIDGTKCKSKLKSCFSQAGEGVEGGRLEMITRTPCIIYNAINNFIMCQDQ